MSYSRHEATDSFCCSGAAVQYWWVNGHSTSGPDAIDEVLDRVERLLKRPGWDLNPYALEEELGHIEALLERASEGRLAPLVEIKSLRRQALERLFEVRHEITVRDLKTMMGRVVASEFRTELMRAYHAEEPVHLPRHAIGLHVHLKATNGDKHEIDRLQDEEIDKAVDVLDAGRPTQWGIN